MTCSKQICPTSWYESYCKEADQPSKQVSHHLPLSAQTITPDSRLLSHRSRPEPETAKQLVVAEQSTRIASYSVFKQAVVCYHSKPSDSTT